MAAGYDGTIKIDTSINTKGFNQGIQKLEGSLGNLAKTITATLGAAFAGIAFGSFAKSAIDAASAAESALIGLRSVINGMGRDFGQAQEFLKSFVADGLIPMNDAVTAYKNLLSRGYDTRQIEDTLLRLKDSAAFGRQAALSIGEAVKGATEGLKNENSILVDNAGVTKNVSMMWKEYADSIGTTVAALTKEQKIQAEVNGIMKETQFQTGDAAKLAGTYAGQIAALGVSFTNLKVALGNILIPIITAILPYIKAFVDSLTFALNQIAQVVQALFGLQPPSQDVAGSLGEAAENAGTLEENTKKAGKAAKGALAAFDELNVLSQGDDNAGGAPGTTPLPALDPSGIDDSLGQVDEKIKAWAEGLKALFQPAIDAFGRLWEALQPLGQTIWEGLKWAWDNILVPFGTWVISEALPVFLDLLAQGVALLDNTLKYLQPVGQWFWDNFLKPLAEWTGKAIIDGLTWLADRLGELNKFLSDNAHLVQDVFIPTLNEWKDKLIEIAGPIIGLIISASMDFENILKELAGIIISLSQSAGETWQDMQRIWGEITGWFLDNVINPLKDNFSRAWDFISSLPAQSLEIIKSTWQGALSWFENTVISPIRNAFDSLWSGLQTGADVAQASIQVAFDGISSGVQTSADVGVAAFKTAWQPVGGWLKNTLLPVISDIFGPAFDTAAKAGVTAFQGMADVLRGVFNRVLEMINGLFDGVFVGINGLIDNVNTLGGIVPGWQTIPTLQAPQIPMLATGAVIPPNSQFMAVLGDQKSGRNLEAPEGLIRQIIREEMGTGSQNITISFDGNLAALVRELRPYIVKENSRVGGTLISGGTIA